MMQPRIAVPIFLSGAVFIFISADIWEFASISGQHQVVVSPVTIIQREKFGGNHFHTSSSLGRPECLAAIRCVISQRS